MKRNFEPRLCTTAIVAAALAVATAATAARTLATEETRATAKPIDAPALAGPSPPASAQVPPAPSTSEQPAHPSSTPAAAEEQPGGQQPAPVDIESALERARSFMSVLEYEKAIAVLEPVLAATRFDPDRLRETYLLLIEAHVYGGNRSPLGSKEQQLWYEEARKLIRECLAVRELRHMQVEPPERFPSEMLQLFDAVRREIFGSFEITKLQPPDAQVIFDGETLTPAADGVWRAVNVPIGARMLVIRRHGYQDFTEDVDIGPATVVARPYELRPKKGVRWYATRVGAPVVAAVGITAAIVSGGGGQPAEPDLPGAPPPPE